MHVKMYHVDAFTDKPFAGNPAAVCLLETTKSDKWMQRVAAEMNLSETAFVTRRPDGFGLRWFTPTVEVDLCGHATLASAHVLWESGALKPAAAAYFHTRSGVLIARKKGAWVELDFPLRVARKCTVPGDLLLALGAKPLFTGCNDVGYLVEVESEKVVRELKPDFSILGRLPLSRAMVTARASTAGYDFVSRYFAPGVGVDEDPVTGSSFCCLGPYWQKKLKKTEMMAYQASRRGGTVRVRVGKDRTYISGEAVTVAVGSIVV